MSDFEVSDARRTSARLTGLALTLVLVLALELLRWTSWWIPNPPALLMVAIVFAAFRGDAKSGWISAAVAWTYCAYYFSDSLLPLDYTAANLRRVAIWALVFPATAAMVGRLRRESLAAARSEAERERLELELSARKREEVVLREAAAQQRASGERFRAIAQAVPIGIFETDASGATVFVNEMWCRLTGRTAEEAMGDGWLDAVHPDDRARVRGGWWDTENKVRVLRSRFRLVHRGGEVHWLEGNAVELRDAEGELSGFLGTLLDVTAVRVAERVGNSRGAILAVVGYAGQELLRRRGWEQSAPEVVRRLGEAAGASRSYLFEDSRDALGNLRSSLRFEWVAQGIEPQIDHPDLQAVSYRDLGLERWADRFRAGEPVHGPVAQLPESERRLLEPQRVRSLAVLPVLVGGAPWGFLGFDDCEEEREWSAVEIDALRAAAATLAAAIEMEGAARELKRSEARYHELFDSSPVELWEEDFSGVHALLAESGFLAAPDPLEFLASHPGFVHGALTRVRVLDVNRKAVEALAAPSKAALLDSLGQVFTERAYAAFASQLVAMHRGETRSALESTARTFDGKEVDTVLQWEVQPGHEANYSRVLVSVVDVSELRRAERELVAQTRYSAAVVDAVRQPLVVLDQELRVRFANAVFDRLFGVDSSELVGSPLAAIAGGEPLAARLDEELRGALGDGDSVDDLEVKLDLPSAGRRVMLLGARRFQTSVSSERMILAALEDVTEARALRREIESARRLETVGKLAGGIAHDFNNLLTVILNSAEFLEPALAGRPESESDLQRIQSAARRAAALTRQLLAFGRRQVLKPRTIDLNAAIRELRELLVRVLPENVSTVLDLAAAPALVEVDAAQLEQVLLNLVVNARDAMPSGGRIEISTRGPAPAPTGRRSPTAATAREGVTIIVADQGVGMDPETLERCFEPFFSNRIGGGGTGLGLSTAHGIVHQSGGAIWAESTPGVGSRFHVFLPRATAPIAAAEPTPVAAPSAGKGSILLVEDDDAVRTMVARMLSSLGYDVEASATPRRAIELARSGRAFDLLVTDVMMAEMDGTRLAAELPELPALFISGYTSELVQLDASTRGRLLQKPFTVAALSAAVRGALQSA